MESPIISSNQPIKSNHKIKLVITWVLGLGFAGIIIEKILREARCGGGYAGIWFLVGIILLFFLSKYVIKRSKLIGSLLYIIFCALAFWLVAGTMLALFLGSFYSYCR